MSVFSVLIKPASSLCNMRCRYCFYADVSDMREVRSYGVMSSETSRRLIERAYEECPSGEVNFSFQGGEPTVAGLDYFLDFSEIAEKLRPENVKINYSIQTNGTLIDEKWCDYFHSHNYLVGLSCDGEEAIHNMCRKAEDREGSFKKVMNAAKLMKKYKVDFNILSVVTRQSAKHPNNLFGFCKKNSFGYLQPIPCLSPLDGSESEFSLTPELYSEFMINLYRLWEREFRQKNYISIRQFDNYVRIAGGGQPEMCGMRGFCQAQFVIEADGSVYPCDFYVLDEYRCGNIYENSFSAILASDNMKKFLRRDPPDERCLSCEARNICGGGCRRFRSLYFRKDGGCAQKDFLLACYPAMFSLARELGIR